MPSQHLPELTMTRRIGFVILSAMFVMAALVAIKGRGPWYDEFYAFYLVRPGASLQMLVPAWLRDNHPPLFYALAWGWSRLIAGAGFRTIVALRTINLAILVAVIGAFWRMARRDTGFARIVWFYGLALAATFPAIDQIDQARSYFLSFALTALVLPLLARQVAGQRATPALGVVLALAFSVHLVTTVIVGALVAATVAQCLVTRRRGDALRLILIAALALVPFVVMMALQLSTIVANTHAFWIPGGINAARWTIEAETQAALFANPVLVLVALAGLVVILIGLRRHERDAQTTAIVITTLTTGLVLALAVLIAVHLVRPLLITRYLVALDPVFALILALFAQSAVRGLSGRMTGVIDALVLLGTGLALHGHCVATLAQPSWDGTGRAIARLVAACPGTTVHADTRWNSLPLSMAPRDNREVVPFAYAFEARRLGFGLSDRGMSATCPNVFWTEHAADQHPSAEAVIGALRGAGFPVRSGRMWRIGYGWILVTPAVG